MNAKALLPAHVDTPPNDNSEDIDGAGKHILTYAAEPCFVVFSPTDTGEASTVRK